MGLGELVTYVYRRMLLENGASVEETDIDHDADAGYEHCPNPIATSALYARENILRALLEAIPGGLGSAIPSTDWTPLMFAAASGSKVCEMQSRGSPCSNICSVLCPPSTAACRATLDRPRRRCQRCELVGGQCPRRA